MKEWLYAPHSKVIFHWICKITCSAFFIYLFFQHITAPILDFNWLGWVLGGGCLFLSFLMLGRPWAKIFIADFHVLLICLLSKTYFLLFDMDVEGNRLGEIWGSVLFSSGIVLWLPSVVWLGKSFSILPAVREIRVTGPYRIIRHPIYCSYIIMELGVLAFLPSWWNGLIIGLAFGIYVIRLNIEEKILSGEKAYQAYCERVRYRLIPLVY